MNKRPSLLQKLKETYANHQEEKALFQKFDQQIAQYNAMAAPDAQIQEPFLFPCLYDATTTTQLDPIYFYQDNWAFERIVAQAPKDHIDIGSHHKFVGFLSKITNLTMVDIRPLSLELNTINFKEGSILELPYEDNSIHSLSSLCVVEHIGLGRYGDPIDPLGSEKAFAEINRVMAIGSDFYMSVPVEEVNKIYYNAHRAFNEDYLLKELLSNYEVVDAAYIYAGKYVRTQGKGFGIGCYHLRKLK